MIWPVQPLRKPSGEAAAGALRPDGSLWGVNGLRGGGGSPAAKIPGLAALLGAAEEGREPPGSPTDVAWYASPFRPPATSAWLPHLPLRRLNEVGGKQSWGSGLAYPGDPDNRLKGTDQRPTSTFLRVDTWPRRAGPAPAVSRPVPVRLLALFFTSMPFITGRCQILSRKSARVFFCPWRKAQGPS